MNNIFSANINKKGVSSNILIIFYSIPPYFFNYIKIIIVYFKIYPPILFIIIKNIPFNKGGIGLNAKDWEILRRKVRTGFSFRSV